MSEGRDAAGDPSCGAVGACERCVGHPARNAASPGSNIARVFPFQTLLPAGLTGLRTDAKAQAEQIRSVAVERIGPVLGLLPPGLMLELDDAVRLHLQL